MVRYVTTCFGLELKICKQCLEVHVLEDDECYECFKTFSYYVPSLKVSDASST
jgi:hypothetical protein